MTGSRLTSIPAPHFTVTRDIDPWNVDTWADLTCCPGHEFFYRFFDLSDRLLYSGVTWNPKERWKYHRKTKLWWRDVAWTFMECHGCDEFALAAEWWSIKNEHPLYNIHGVVR